MLPIEEQVKAAFRAAMPEGLNKGQRTELCQLLADVLVGLNKLDRFDMTKPELDKLDDNVDALRTKWGIDGLTVNYLLGRLTSVGRTQEDRILGWIRTFLPREPQAS